MNETTFRILAAVVFFTGISISIYFRRKADKAAGEKISRKVDGSAMLIVIKIGGLALWLSPFAYLLNPAWMVWSKIRLPEAIRWLGVIAGILCVFGIYWLFSSIGNNISPTSATRKEHTLVTSGPYRWVRHPLYAGSMLIAAGFAVASRNWWVVLAMAVMFAAIYWPVMLSEEEYLRANFAGYDEYARRVPRLLPWKHGPATAGGFSPALYRKHREYNALLGAMALFAVLAIKMYWIR
jgi:protein-S-isoprenylcysteine O-methyltransferase Ste14